MTKYAIVVETRRCIGCSSCSVACKLENNLPDQVWYSRVETIGGEAPNTPAGEYGNNTLDYVVVQCNHCDMPLCVAACSTGATYKDDETGLVLQDAEKCIGCQACITACPYDVRTYINGDPIAVLDWLRDNKPDGVWLSLMFQYTPVNPEPPDPALARRVTARECRKVWDALLERGLTDGYVQDRASATTAYIPEFDLTGV